MNLILSYNVNDDNELEKEGHLFLGAGEDHDSEEVHVWLRNGNINDKPLGQEAWEAIMKAKGISLPLPYHALSEYMQYYLQFTAELGLRKGFEMGKEAAAQYILHNVPDGFADMYEELALEIRAIPEKENK